MFFSRESKIRANRGEKEGVNRKATQKVFSAKYAKKGGEFIQKSFKTTKVNFQFLINFSFVSVVLVAVVFVIKNFS